MSSIAKKYPPEAFALRLAKNSMYVSNKCNSSAGQIHVDGENLRQGEFLYSNSSKVDGNGNIITRIKSPHSQRDGDGKFFMPLKDEDHSIVEQVSNMDEKYADERAWFSFREAPGPGKLVMLKNETPGRERYLRVADGNGEDKTLRCGPVNFDDVDDVLRASFRRKETGDAY